jgi:16S rRNA A1518/A1519 N6-dimethyltransferase RsmA/KsgA/DIM1 with predicted DNA glycosylase/AP lyase activity
VIFLAFSGLVLLFGFVLFFGAPYLPTRRAQAQAALDLLELKKGQTLYELGCGDGRVLKQAAEKGMNAVGYELNPVLVMVAWMNTIRYRQQVKIIWGDFWRADLSKADGIFVFLLDRFMTKLDDKMKREITKPIKLVSYAFKIPGKKPVKYKAGMYLYEY